MNKFFRTFFLCSLLATIFTVSAYASEDTLKVGLYYGGSALFSANLENYQGSGYELGWFDEGSRDFVSLGSLEERQISMTASGTIYLTGKTYSPSASRYDAVIGGYHVQLEDAFLTYQEARYVADQFTGGFVAYINDSFRVRVGHFLTREEAEIAAATYSTYTWYDLSGGVHSFSGSAVSPSATGVTVTVTGTDRILFAFDCSGARALGILPRGQGQQAVTWFKGYKWYGGFEYRRSTGGSINVINVVDIDDYVKGVLPYEMNAKWPLEALKAQAVCARTYALLQTKHSSSYRFDVCNTTDCQVYRGVNAATAQSDRAAEETAGIVAMYGGKYAETYYCSSNGGATESAENVWSTALPYLVGREDPYEAMISIPDYRYSVTYTWDELTRLLQSKNYNIGAVRDAYVSRRTPTGNVLEVTFTDAAGKSVSLKGEKCRTVLSTSLFGAARSVKSMRFSITGGTGGGNLFINSGSSAPGLSGLFTISGAGQTAPWGGGQAYVITGQGTAPLDTSAGQTASPSAGGITITGTGSGHNVGMSQYGARAMAEQGRTYQEILDFYFTGITLERVG